MSQNLNFIQNSNVWQFSLLALFGSAFGLVVAEEELPVEQLDADHGKDEQEEDVDDEDVEHVPQRNDHTVKHSLDRRN